MGHINGDGAVRIVDDMHVLYNIMHKRYPDLPYFLFGHSMGSFAANLCPLFGYGFAVFVFAGTGQLPEQAGLLEMPLDLLIKYFGHDGSVGNLFRLAGKFQSLQFEGKTGDENAWLSRNKENREDYAADPCADFPFPQVV